MTKKKSYILALLMTCAFSTFSSPVMAQEQSPAIINIIDEENPQITPKAADVIVYKYRTYNGKLQYRRWNSSREVWVDPYWIDC